MTVQTELVGDPLQLATIVDFRGRVLKRWTHPFSLDPDDATCAGVIREWHATIEARVRENLARAVRQRLDPKPSDGAISRLFLAAMAAYRDRDIETARAAMRACVLVLPDDRRVRAALEQLGERSPRAARASHRVLNRAG